MPLDYLTIIGLVLKPLEWVARILPSRQRQKEEDLEENILEYMADQRDWASPGLVWSELFVKPILSDVPFIIAFPPPLEGWAKVKWRIKHSGYAVRHRWRVWRHVIPEGRVFKTMRRLWKQRILQRMANDEMYRLT